MSTDGWLTEADGVFRGGGVKGLGLAGALLGFADHPERPITRWRNVAGASAGAIIACWLAVHGEAGAAGLESLLSATDFAQFEDFPAGGTVWGGGRNLLFHHGLARGDRFREWFEGQLNHATFADVRDGADWRLKLVAVDVTNQGLLLLPDDLAYYRETAHGPTIDPDRFSIAHAARMSMSIPYFFEPVTLYRERVRCTAPGETPYNVGDVVDRREADQADEDCRKAKDPVAEWQPVEPELSVIIDGGTLSNFPVWIFDADPRRGERIQRMTFGFTLTGGKGLMPSSGLVNRMTPWPVKFGGEIFHTAQSAWDKRFAAHSSVVRTVTVNAGNVATTDFTLSDADKKMLVSNGRDAATRFLDNFDPRQYQNTYGVRFNQ
jgi:NTE family protein